MENIEILRLIVSGDYSGAIKGGAEYEKALEKQIAITKDFADAVQKNALKSAESFDQYKKIVDKALDAAAKKYGEYLIETGNHTKEQIVSLTAEFRKHSESNLKKLIAEHTRYSGEIQKIDRSMVQKRNELAKLSAKLDEKETEKARRLFKDIYEERSKFSAKEIIEKTKELNAEIGNLRSLTKERNASFKEEQKQAEKRRKFAEKKEDIGVLVGAKLEKTQSDRESFKQVSSSELQSITKYENAIKNIAIAHEEGRITSERALKLISNQDRIYGSSLQKLKEINSQREKKIKSDTQDVSARRSASEKKELIDHEIKLLEKQGADKEYLREVESAYKNLYDNIEDLNKQSILELQQTLSTKLDLTKRTLSEQKQEEIKASKRVQIKDQSALAERDILKTITKHSGEAYFSEIKTQLENIKNEFEQISKMDLGDPEIQKRYERAKMDLALMNKELAIQVELDKKLTQESAKQEKNATKLAKRQKQLSDLRIQAMSARGTQEEKDILATLVKGAETKISANNSEFISAVNEAKEKIEDLKRSAAQIDLFKSRENQKEQIRKSVSDFAPEFKQVIDEELSKLSIDAPKVDWDIAVQGVKNQVKDIKDSVKKSVEETNQLLSKKDITTKAEQQLKILREKGLETNSAYQSAVLSLGEVADASKNAGISFEQQKRMMTSAMNELQLANIKYSKQQKEQSQIESDLSARTEALRKRDSLLFRLKNQAKIDLENKFVKESIDIYGKLYANLDKLNSKEIKDFEARLASNLSMAEKTIKQQSSIESKEAERKKAINKAELNKEFVDFELNELKKNKIVEDRINRTIQLQNELHNDIKNKSKEQIELAEKEIANNIRIAKMSVSKKAKEDMDVIKREKIRTSAYGLESDVDLFSDLYGSNDVLESIKKDLVDLAKTAGDLSVNELQNAYLRIKSDFDRYKAEIKRDVMEGRTEEAKTKLTEKIGSSAEKAETQAIKAVSTDKMQLAAAGINAGQFSKIKTELEQLNNELKSGAKTTLEAAESYARLSYELKQSSEKLSQVKSAASQAEREYGLLRRGLYDTLNVIQSSIFFFGALTASIVAFTKKMVGAYTRYEETVQKFKGVSYQGGSIELLNAQTKEFENTVRRIAAGSKFTASQVAYAGVEMAKLGLSTQEVVIALDKVILAAEASGESIENVAKVVIGVKEAFGKTANDIGFISDLITQAALTSSADIESIGQTLKYVGPIARATGQDISMMTGLTAILGQNMVLGSQAGTNMKNMLVRLSKITPQARQALEALGLKAVDPITGKMKQLDEFLFEIAGKFEQLPNSTRNAVSAILFGERAIVGASAIINSMIEDSTKVRKELDSYSADKVTGTTETIKKITFTGLFAEIVKLKSEFEELNISMGEAFKPTILTLIDVFKWFVDVAKRVPPQFLQIAGLVTVLAGGVSGLMLVISLLAKGLYSLAQAQMVARQGSLLQARANAILAASTTDLTIKQNANAAAMKAATAAAGGMAIGFRALFAQLGIVGIAFIALSGITYAITEMFRKNAEQKEKYLSKFKLDADMTANLIELKKDYLSILEKINNEEKLSASDYEKMIQAQLLDAAELKKEAAALGEAVSLIDKYKKSVSGDLNIKNIGGYITSADYFFSDAEKQIIENALGKDFVKNLDTKKLEEVVKIIENAKTQMSSVLEMADESTKQANELVLKFANARIIETSEAKLMNIEQRIKELVLLEEKTSSPELRKRIEEEILKEKEKHLAVQKEIGKLAGDENLTDQERLLLLDKSITMQKNLEQILERSKEKNKSIVDLIKEQNDQRAFGISLMEKELEIANEIEYGRQIGTEFSELKTPPLREDIAFFNQTEQAAKNKEFERTIRSIQDNDKAQKKLIEDYLNGIGSAPLPDAAGTEVEETQTGMGARKIGVAAYGPLGAGNISAASSNASFEYTNESRLIPKGFENLMKMYKDQLENLSDIYLFEAGSFSVDQLTDLSNHIENILISMVPNYMDLVKAGEDGLKDARVSFNNLLGEFGAISDFDVINVELPKNISNELRNKLKEEINYAVNQFHKLEGKSIQWFDDLDFMNFAKQAKEIQASNNKIVVLKENYKKLNDELNKNISAYEAIKNAEGADEERQSLRNRYNEIYSDIQSTSKAIYEEENRIQERITELTRKRTDFEEKSQDEIFEMRKRDAELYNATAFDMIRINYEQEYEMAFRNAREKMRQIATLDLTEKQYNEAKARVEQQYRKDREAADIKSIQAIDRENRRIAKEIFDIKSENEISLMSLQADSLENRIRLINLNSAKEMRDIQEQITELKNDPNAKGLKESLKEKLKIKELERQDAIRKETFAFEKQRIEVLERQRDLLNRQSIIYNQIKSTADEIADIAFNSESNVGEVIKEMIKLQKPIDRKSIQDFRNTFNKESSAQIKNMRNEISLIDKFLADEVKSKGEAVKTTKEYVAEEERRADILQRINGIQQFGLTINNQNISVAAELISKIRYLRQDFEAVNSSVNDLSSVLSGLGQEGLSNFIKGISEASSRMLDLVEGGAKLSVLFDKKMGLGFGSEGIPKSIIDGEKQISKAFGGGADIMSAIGSLLADPSGMLLVLQMLPAAIDLLSKFIDGYIDAFFPSLSQKFQQFKDDLTKKTNDILAERDRQLFEAGDISAALFNERELNRVASNYEIRLREIDKEISEKQNEMFWNSAPAMGLDAVQTLLFPPKAVFDSIANIFGFGESELEKELKDQAVKLQKYKDALIEEAKFQKEQAERELKKQKILRESAFEFEMAELLGNLASTEADIARNTDLKREADHHLAKLSLLKEYNEQYAEWMAAGGESNKQASEKFYTQRELYLKRVESLEQKHNDELDKIENDRVKAMRNANVAINNAMNDRSEFQKKRYAAEMEFENRLADLRLQLSQTGDPEDRAIIEKQIVATYKERSNQIQDITRETERAFKDLAVTIKESFAGLTDTVADDAATGYEKRLNEIDNLVEDMLERFAGEGREKDIMKMAANLRKKASLDYIREFRQEQIDVALETAEITSQALENQGRTIDSITTDAIGQAQALADELQIFRLMYSNPADEQKWLNKYQDTQNKLYDIAKTAFDRIQQARKDDLDQYLEIERLKAENAYDNLKVAEIDARIQLQSLAFERMFAQQTIKDPAQLNKALEKIQEQEKKARREAVETGANQLIDQLNKIKTIREEIYEDEIKVYQADIKNNEREIRRLNTQIAALDRRKTEIQREIRDALIAFDKEGVAQYKKAISEVQLDPTIMDALEYISNPTGISWDMADFKTVLESIDAMTASRKEMAEYDFAFKNITEEEYNQRLKQVYIEQGAAYEYAMSLRESAQADSIKRLKEEGKTEAEIRIVQKMQLQENADLRANMTSALQNYIQIGRSEIEKMHQAELEMNEQRRNNLNDTVEDFQESNRLLQDEIDQRAEQLEQDLDPVNEKIKEIEASMRNWNISIGDVRQNMMGLMNDFVQGFESYKQRIESMNITVPFQLPKEFQDILGVLGIKPTKTAEQLRQEANNQARSISQSSPTASQIYGGNQRATIGSTSPYSQYPTSTHQTTNNIRTPEASTVWAATHPLFSYKTGRYYKSYEDQLLHEKIMGFSKGGLTGHTPFGSPSRDYIIGALGNNELISPVRDFKDFAYSLIRDTSEGKIRGVSSSKTTVNQFTFGNVYGVDELENTISRAIKKSNSMDGYYNAPYTTGYS